MPPPADWPCLPGQSAYRLPAERAGLAWYGEGEERVVGARFVVGVSGSPASLAALRVGVEEARRGGRVLVAVIAWEPPEGEGLYARRPDRAWARHWEAVARERLDQAFEEALGGAPEGVVVERWVVRGKAGPAVCDLAAAGSADDLVVLGGGGRGGGGYGGTCRGVRVAGSWWCRGLLYRGGFGGRCGGSERRISPPPRPYPKSRLRRPGVTADHRLRRARPQTPDGLKRLNSAWSAVGHRLRRSSSSCAGRAGMPLLRPVGGGSPAPPSSSSCAGWVGMPQLQAG
ncbi:universal stress protein [Streptomyces sp. NPDC054871]